MRIDGLVKLAHFCVGESQRQPTDRMIGIQPDRLPGRLSLDDGITRTPRFAQFPGPQSNHRVSQLERKGVHLAAGPQAYLLAMFSVSAVMRKPDDPRAADEARCWELIGEGIYVDAAATLEVALPIFDRSLVPFIPVGTMTGKDSAPELKGAVFHVDALKAYNRALAATAAEEHR